MQSRESINFSWIVTLRWGAVVGQAVIILLVHFVGGIALPLGALFAILALTLVSNLACQGMLRRGAPIGESTIDVVMLLDVLLLTALLYLTGGPFNPFSFLYLVNAALGAVVLRPARAWTLAAFSLSCFAVLFVDHHPLALGAGEHAHHGEDSMLVHLRGMWVAFGVTAGFIVYFIQRVTRALAARDTELASARARRAREDRLASLATLAAGAAHELATPLSTIAVVARELERQLAVNGTPETAEDARLIRSQVARCRDILDQMSADAGGSTGETAAVVDLATLIEDAVGGTSTRDRIQIRTSPDASGLAVRVPPRALARAIRSVLKNACEASSEETPVTVAVASDAAGIRIGVRDQGRGMTPDVLARADEPFFTTKADRESASGMGLGLFLTRAILEQLGGRLELASTPGAGTTVTLVLPPTVVSTSEDALASTAPGSR